MENNKFVEKQGYSHIEICIKFKEKGNFFINFLSEETEEEIKFFVKLEEENEVKCIFKMFFELNEFEKRILESSRKVLTIYTSKVEEEEEKYEDGEMVVFDENMEGEIYEETLYVFELQPLFNFGINEFNYSKVNENIKKRKREEDNQIGESSKILKIN